ncbi:hypothetical protein R4849_12685 [Acinetobacter baumannii]|nr:hypothetical protein [Acinetobacter baumannii]
MYSVVSKIIEEYIFYIEIREFDNELILWSGYLLDNYEINKHQIVFYNIAGDCDISLQGNNKTYDVNLFFLEKTKVYFGSYQFSAEYFEVKDSILALGIYEDDFDLSCFKIGLINKYRQKKIHFRDWWNLNEEQKQEWLKVSYWIQQYKPLSLINSIVIDGRYIRSLNDFLCYIGEEVNGIMGYLGSSFGSLSDSLTGGLGDRVIPLNITWVYFKETKHFFDNHDDLLYLIEMLDKEAVLKIYDRNYE